MNLGPWEWWSGVDGKFYEKWKWKM